MVVVSNVEALIRLRVRADISQVELAKEIGISDRALRYFENEGRPLPRMRDANDYLEAITAIKTRRAELKKAS